MGLDARLGDGRCGIVVKLDPAKHTKQNGDLDDTVVELLFRNVDLCKEVSAGVEVTANKAGRVKDVLKALVGADGRRQSCHDRSAFFLGGADEPKGGDIHFEIRYIGDFLARNQTLFDQLCRWEVGCEGGSI